LSAVLANNRWCLFRINGGAVNYSGVVQLDPQSRSSQFPSNKSDAAGHYFFSVRRQKRKPPVCASGVSRRAYGPRLMECFDFDIGHTTIWLQFAPIECDPPCEIRRPARHCSRILSGHRAGSWHFSRRQDHVATRTVPSRRIRDIGSD
jgi:hypothetical protein